MFGEEYSDKELGQFNVEFIRFGFGLDFFETANTVCTVQKDLNAADANFAFFIQFVVFKRFSRKRKKKGKKKWTNFLERSRSKMLFVCVFVFFFIPCCLDVKTRTSYRTSIRLAVACAITWQEMKKPSGGEDD